MLFDFAATPGRFSIALREPRIAFDNIQSVLMLACGRKLDAVPAGRASEADVRRVARYFIRTAMLRPGADYYTLLGVQPGFAETTLREHYRLLMRLSHPDFATPGQVWPADAATRINLANDVLSSSVRRHEYDTSVALASVARPQAVMGAAGSMAMRRVPPKPRASVLARIGAAMASLFGGVATAVGSFPLRRLLGGLSFPRRRASTATVALASVIAAVGGAATTAWWMQDDAQHAGKLAAQPARALSDALNVSAYGPTLRSTVEIDLPANLVGKPVARKAVVEVAEAAPRLVDPVPPALSRNVEAPLARNDSAFQFSFAPAGARPVDAAPRQAPQVQMYSQQQQQQQQRQQPQPQQPARAQAPAQLQQAQATQAASPEPAFIARNAPSPAPAPVAEPAVVAVAPPAAAPVSSPAPAPVPVAVAATPIRMMPKFSLADVQPMLANVIGAMQSGRADNVLQMVDASSRRSDGGAAFSEAYNRTVFGAKTVQLGKVTLSSLPLDDQLVVDGTVQLMVMDGNSVTTSKDLYIRAWFVARAGSPVLTRISATPGRQ